MKLIVKLFSGFFAVLLLLTAVFPLIPVPSASAAPSEVPFSHHSLEVIECQLTAEFGQADGYVGNNGFLDASGPLIELAYQTGDWTTIGNLNTNNYIGQPNWYIHSTPGASPYGADCADGFMAVFFQDPDDPTRFIGFQDDRDASFGWEGPIFLKINNSTDESATEIKATISDIRTSFVNNDPTELTNINIGIQGSTVGSIVGVTPSGSPGSGGGGLPTTQYSWYWKDIGTIERRAPRPGGSTVVETYTMERWGGSEHRYYLAQTTLPNRAELVDSSGWGDQSGNSIDCRPYLSFKDDGGGLDLGFNNDQSGATRFNNLRNALQNNSTGKFHDFTALEVANRCQDSGDDINITPGSNINKQIFFKYYPTENKITTILRANDGDNEQIYTGLYDYSNTPGRYDLKDSGCTTNPTRIEFTGAAPTTTAAISATYRMRDVCADGTDIPVRIIAATSGVSPPSGTIGEGSDGGGTAVDRTPTCKSALDNGFGWLICPILDMADKFIDWAEGTISGKLEVNESFFKNEQLKEVWTQMARVSSAILVMVGLFMVISTALGFDVVSSYTLKKVLPRMVIAAVGIWLSWALATSYISFMNTLGKGVADLMYSPFGAAEGVSFPNMDLKYIVTKSFENSGTRTDLIATGLLGGIAATAIAGMTVFGILAAAVPIVGAIAIGLFVLALRESVIIFLVALAPLGVAAWILPNTNKAWKLWSGTFNKLLLMYPLFMGIFAAGKIFALISAQSTATSNGMIQVVIPMIAYVSPFFFLPALFKTAGGIFSNLTGMVNNRSKGLFDKATNSLKAKNDAAGKYKKTLQGEKRAQAAISGYKLPFSSKRVSGTRALARGRIRADSGQPIFGGYTDASKNRTESAFQTLQSQVIETQTKEADNRLSQTTYYSDKDVLTYIAADKSRTLGERAAATERLITLRATNHLEFLKTKMTLPGDGTGNVIWQDKTTKKFGDIREFAPQLISDSSAFTDKTKVPSAEGLVKWNRDTWVDALNTPGMADELNDALGKMIADPQLSRTVNESLLAELQAYVSTGVPLTGKSAVAPKSPPK